MFHFGLEVIPERSVLGVPRGAQLLWGYPCSHLPGAFCSAHMIKLKITADARRSLIYDKSASELITSDGSEFETDPQDLLAPFPNDLLAMWPISKRVNSPDNDDERPLDEISLASNTAA